MLLCCFWEVWAPVTWQQLLEMMNRGLKSRARVEWLLITYSTCWVLWVIDLTRRFFCLDSSFLSPLLAVVATWCYPILLINCELLIVPQVKELPTLQKELKETKQALANVNQDKEKLLQEIRKYNPLFEL